MTDSERLEAAFKSLYAADWTMADATPQDFAELIASNLTQLEGLAASTALDDLRSAVDGDLTTTARQKRALFRVAAVLRTLVRGGLAV